MARLLYSLGRTAYTHSWRFIAAWLVVIFAIGGAAVTWSKPTTANFSIPGLPSVATQERVAELFPNASASDPTQAPIGNLVIRAPEGKTLTDPDVMAQTQKLLDSLKKLAFLTKTEELLPPPVAAQFYGDMLTRAKRAQNIPPEQIKNDIAALTPLSPDNRTGIVRVTFAAEKAEFVRDEDKKSFESTVRANDGDLTVGWSGIVFERNHTDATAELVGIAVAAIVLIVTFGSLVAAGLPLLTAIVGLGCGLGLVFAATSLTEAINNTTPTLATMIGLAVGIDYALFILARFRSEAIRLVQGENLTPRQFLAALRTTTREQRAHAAGLAIGRAGSAVVFAGLTVVIALAALSVINIPFLTAMALAASGTVAIAVLVALTLLPAILGVGGANVFAWTIPFVKAPHPDGDKPGMGARWIRMIGRTPILWALAAALPLALLAIPAMNLRLAMPNDGTATLGSPARTAYEMTEEAFGPGRNAPMLALLEYESTPPQERIIALNQALMTIGETEGVSNVQVVALNGDPANPADLGTAAQLAITPKFGATDPRATTLLNNLRAAAEPFTQKTGASYEITGVTPVYEDISARLADALVPYISIVLVLAFVLLMIVFRSFWVPLIAALGFLLSVGATFGITVALWQQGMWGLVEDPQALISFLPVLLIGIIFGLAMDYQVFLVSGIREGWAHGMKPEEATRHGFTQAARVVTAAAAIMIAVFSAFILMDQQFIRVMGFALAAAVFFDAFVVRMTFIPATMFLLGQRAWSIPRWLDRILPHVDVEGESLATAAPAAPASQHRSGVTMPPAADSPRLIAPEHAPAQAGAGAATAGAAGGVAAATAAPVIAQDANRDDEPSVATTDVATSDAEAPVAGAAADTPVEKPAAPTTIRDVAQEHDGHGPEILIDVDIVPNSLSPSNDPDGILTALKDTTAQLEDAIAQAGAEFEAAIATHTSGFKAVTSVDVLNGTALENFDDAALDEEYVETDDADDNSTTESK